MQLYDTARRAVVPFQPRGDEVSLYVCGITPYDASHLGHAFTYHVFDVLTRRLQQKGLRVHSARNVTDVDDDILRVARERHVDFRALGDEQVRRFDADMAAIDILPVTSAPRATQHVPEMVRWIGRLMDSGHAYARDGWVYFRVRSYPAYGALSRLDRAAMIESSRSNGADPDDPRKEDPLDFVLWQPSLPDEPRWPSPWSAGRPGWHIECTVLASGELGTPVDIHGGGDDLIFPHHECESAQAVAAGADPYVRHWVHVAMVRYRGEKMSKSLGNLVFIRDTLERVPPATVRLLLSAHHHLESWDHDDAELAVADARRHRYEDALARGGRIERAQADELRRRFTACVDADLDTPRALQVADEAVVALTAAGGGPDTGVAAAEVLPPMLSVLGVALQPVVAPPAR